MNIYLNNLEYKMKRYYRNYFVILLLGVVTLSFGERYLDPAGTGTPTYNGAYVFKGSKNIAEIHERLNSKNNYAESPLAEVAVV